MDRNRTTLAIARRVSYAISEADSTANNVAQAADITTSELEDRLTGRVEFQIDELVRVGGFLRIPVSQLLEVAA